MISCIINSIFEGNVHHTTLNIIILFWFISLINTFIKKIFTNDRFYLILTTIAMLFLYYMRISRIVKNYDVCNNELET